MLLHCSCMPVCWAVLSESRSESRVANFLAVCCDCSFLMSNILCVGRCTFFAAQRHVRSFGCNEVVIRVDVGSSDRTYI